MLHLLAQESSDYLYQTTYQTSAQDAGALAALTGVMMIPNLILSVLMLVSSWKIYAKAGKPGWAAIVPIYNLVVLLQIAGMPMWWLAVALLGIILVPVLGLGILVLIGMNIVIGINLAKKFGKDTTFGVVLLGIFGFIGYPILAFGSAQYQSGTATPAAPAQPQAPTPPPAPTA